MLFRSLEKSCPPREVKLPQWDVSLVLEALRGAPYEPLKQASDRNLTLKTVFLLSLASAKGVSELHALSAQVGHSEGWRSMSFSFVPDLVARTQKPSILDHRFDGFSIPSLKDFTGDDPEETLLCPVRAMPSISRGPAPFVPGNKGGSF